MAASTTAALVRLAWRDARLDKRAVAVLAVLFALPVALATGGGVVARSMATAAVHAADPRDLGFVYLMGALALAEACLAASAILGVRARRRIHAYGVLDVAGATRRQRAAVALLGGMIPGTAGTVAGAILGIAGGVLALPVLASGRGLAAPHPSIMAVDLAIPGVAAAGAVILASAGPALLVGRIATHAALAGRRPTPESDPRTLVAIGGGLAVVGTAAVAVGALVPGISVVLVVLGTVAVAAGFGLLVPSVLRRVAACAKDASPPLRIALRDLARDWQRTVPAVAAVMACEALAVSVSVVLTAGESRDAVSYASIRGLVLAVCATVAFSVLGLAAGITGAEADAERLMLGAIGLPRSFVHRAAAAQAAAMALAGGVLAVPAGLLPAVAVLLGRGTYTIAVPWDALALALFAVPMGAWMGGALLARVSESAALARTP